MLLRGFGAVLSMFFRVCDRATLLQVASLCGGAYYHFALHRSRLGNALKRLLVWHFRVAKCHPFIAWVILVLQLARPGFKVVHRKPVELSKFDHGGA